MSTVLTTQPHFLFSNLILFFFLPKWENVLLSFQIPSVTIYSRLHHLGSVQPHSQLDASTYSPADFTQICPAAARMLSRIVCQKHLIGAMWPFEHQESSGEKQTIIKWSGNLKSFNILYRNRNNVGVYFRCYTGRLLCTTDPSSLILHCGAQQVKKCCNFFAQSNKAVPGWCIEWLR